MPGHRISIKPLISFCVGILKSSIKDSALYPQVFSTSETFIICEALFDELVEIAKDRGIGDDCAGIIDENCSVLEMMRLLTGKCILTGDSNSSPAYIGETLQLLAAFSTLAFTHKDKDLENEDGATALQKRRVCEFILKVCLGLVPRTQVTLRTLCQQTTRTDRTSMNKLLVKESDEAYNVLRLYGSANDGCGENETSWLLDTLSQIHVSVGSAVEALDWSFNPDRDVRSLYVGLKNLGATCYMNSFMQVLFMNPIVRCQVLGTSVVLSSEGSDNPAALAAEKAENLVCQLQDMFCALEHSTRRSYNPRGWTHAFKDPTGLAPVNVMVQQDAQEFLGTLFHRLEGQLFVAPADLPLDQRDKKVPLLQHCFGGTLCNQIVKEGIGTPSADDIRENSEPFVCISLEVKGCSDLESSMRKFVAGESFPDYEWDSDQPRVSITKRQCLLNDELPQSLIFHLKRFEFNLDTFLREKVNDEFSFPVDTPLDVYPFTKEGLQGVGATCDNKDVSSCLYTLGAVVVHTGTAEGGHYFSYIKESYEDVVSRLKACAAPGQSCSLSPEEVEKSRRWIEFNDTEISLFAASRIPAECFGGMTVSHDFDLHSHTVETSTIVNPKSAYMLIYDRVQCQEPRQELIIREMSVECPVPALQRTVSSVESSLAEPLLRDNQLHTLIRRVFSQNHLKCSLEFAKSSIVQAWSTVQALAKDNAATSAFQNASRAFTDQLCQGVYFVLHFLSKSSSSLETLYKEGVDFLLEQLTSLPAGTVSRGMKRGSSPVGGFSSADVLVRGSVISTSEGVVYQENIPPPVPPSSALQGLDTHHSSEETNVEKSTQEQEQVIDNEDEDDMDDEEMRLALSLSLGEDVDVGKVMSLQSQSQSPAKEVENESPVVDMMAEKLADTSALATRRVMQLMLHDLFSQPSLPTSSNTDDMRVSSLQTMLFAPSQEVRQGYAKLLHNLYCSALEIPSPGSMSTDCTRPARNVLGSTAQHLLYDDIMSVSSTSSTPPQYVEFDLGLLSGPSSQSLCVGLVLHLTRNSMFMHAAEQWRRCDSYFWLLRQIASSSFEAREVMIQRDVLVQLVDLVVGNLSPACGLLYASGSRKHPPTSFVSVVPDKTGALPKHASPTSLPDFTDLFHLLADLVTSTATDAMLTGSGIPPTFSNMSASGYAGEAVNLNTLQNRLVSFAFCSEEVTVNPSVSPVPGGQHFNPNEMVIVHDALFSTALKQARYVPALLRIMTHMAFESVAVSNSVAEVLVRAVSFASLGETSHVFEAVAAFLKIEDSLSMRRAQMVLENAGGLFSVLQEVAFVVKNPTKVCVCLTSLLKILHDVPVAREAVSTPRAKVDSWAVWMLRFSYQYREKASKEDQLALALALSASVAESKSDGDNAVDETSLLKTMGPFLLVYGEDEEERESSWTNRSSKCFSMLRALLVLLGKDPDLLIPTDAFEDYDTATFTTGTGGLAGNGAAPAAASNTITASSLNANNKRNVTDLTSDVMDCSSTDGLTGFEDMPALVPSGGDQQQQPNLENMTDAELAQFLASNQDFM